MIRRIIRKIQLMNIILELETKEPNDYSLGYKVRKLINLYKGNEEIVKEEIFKEIPKP